MGVQYDMQRPWKVMLQVSGSVWQEVLPYCVVNMLLTFVVYWASNGENKEWYSFSPQGHTMMSLIVSFLVVQKINLAYERFMTARKVMGKALISCRELHQMVLTFTSHDHTMVASDWRVEIKKEISVLLYKTLRVLKDKELPYLLTVQESPNQIYNNRELLSNEDPMAMVQQLRLHLFKGYSVGEGDHLALLEKVKLLDHLKCFVDAYEGLLALASTPLPFPLVQMGRTFLFLWIFTMPCALVGHVFSDLYSVLLFVFFLTYGFIGLEFVGMQMLHPFGDGVNDLGIDALTQGVLVAIENDANLMKEMQAGVVYQPPPPGFSNPTAGRTTTSSTSIRELPGATRSSSRSVYDSTDDYTTGYTTGY